MVGQFGIEPPGSRELALESAASVRSRFILTRVARSRTVPPFVRKPSSALRVDRPPEEQHVAVGVPEFESTQATGSTPTSLNMIIALPRWTMPKKMSPGSGP